MAWFLDVCAEQPRVGESIGSKHGDRYFKTNFNILYLDYGTVNHNRNKESAIPNLSSRFTT